MQPYLTAAEERLAEIIWRDAPIASPDLVDRAGRELNWKKSTTYTVLKKLCVKGVFKSENTYVTALITRDELITHQSRRFVEDSFGGSLPQFLAAFIGGSKLTPDQAADIKRLIDESEGGGGIKRLIGERKSDDGINRLIDESEGGGIKQAIDESERGGGAIG